MVSSGLMVYECCDAMRGTKLHSIYVLYCTTVMVVQSTVVMVAAVMYDAVRIYLAYGPS